MFVAIMCYGSSVVEPKDRPLLEPVMDFMLFQTPDETCEAFQVLKVSPGKIVSFGWDMLAICSLRNELDQGL